MQRVERGVHNAGLQDILMYVGTGVNKGDLLQQIQKIDKTGEGASIPQFVDPRVVACKSSMFIWQCLRQQARGRLNGFGEVIPRSNRLVACITLVRSASHSVVFRLCCC